MKVAIVGSRKFPAMDAVRAYVRRLPKGTIVVSGAGAERVQRLESRKWGVDVWAEYEATQCGIVVVSYPAKWKRPDGTYDRGAGFARNGLIAEAAERVVAFWDGKSRGTRDTIEKAHKMRRPIEIYLYDPAIGIHMCPLALALTSRA